MRSLHFTFLLSLLCSLLIAQDVTTDRKGMVLGVYDALMLEFENTDKSFIEKEWRDFGSKYGKVSKVKKSQQWMLPGANLVNYDGIGVVTLYTEAAQVDSSVQFALWVELDSTFMSPDNEEAWSSGNQLMKDFALKVKIDRITMELEDEQKTLDKLEREMERLVSNHDKYVSTIDKSHEAITQAENDLVVNQREQESTSAQIEALRANSTGQDTEKELKKLEKQMRKLTKQNVKYVNLLSTNKDRITQNEANIEQNLIDQEAKKEEIATQKAITQEVRDRLDSARSREGS